MDPIPMPCACTIAGSDPGGGAGLQADLKTFSACSVWGATVVTALTAQTSCAVRGAWPVPANIVCKQMQAVFEDLPVRAVKTGMLGSAEICHTVATGLPPGIPLVVDPVMVSTSGDRLLAEDAVHTLISELLPCAAVVTPNLPEATILAGTEMILSVPEMEEAARAILELGPRYVVIKGGHLGGENSPDLLVGPGLSELFPAKRVPYDVHGSGCCFSAAITAYLARGEKIADAVRHG